MSPIASNIGGVPHGRFTHPEGGEPPEVWITETNLAPQRGGTPRSEMSAADVRHVQSKIVLRDLAVFVNKGVTALHFYAANAGEFSLVDPGFFSALKSKPTTYPGDSAGGQTTNSVRRLTESFDGAEPITSPRSLSLRELTDYSGNVQFQGNGTAEFPPLHNRDVLAFLPFQIDESSFAIPIYVMTRNVVKNYRPGSTAPTRFDMPAEPYGLTIGGIDGEHASVSATDPLTGESVPVEVLSRAADQIEVKMQVTDSPRTLVIEDDGPAPVEEPPARATRCFADRRRATGAIGGAEHSAAGGQLPRVHALASPDRRRELRSAVRSEVWRTAERRTAQLPDLGRRGQPVRERRQRRGEGRARDQHPRRKSRSWSACGGPACHRPADRLRREPFGGSTAQRTLTLRRRPLGVAPGSRAETLFLPW